MKILIFGFTTFIIWSIFSTYIYVCKIKGLCIDASTIVLKTDSVNKVNNSISLVAEQLKVPNDITIYFDFDKSDFKPNLKTGAYYSASKAFIIQNANAKLVITGYTDAVGTIDYNQALGKRRAQSLQNYFINKGIDANRMVIVSKGELEPSDDNFTIDGRANNRKTLVTLKK